MRARAHTAQREQRGHNLSAIGLEGTLANWTMYNASNSAAIAEILVKLGVTKYIKCKKREFSRFEIRRCEIEQTNNNIVIILGFGGGKE